MSFKKSSARRGVFSKICLSLLISAAILLALCAVATAVAYFTPDPMSLVKPLSVAVTVTSACVSAAINSRLFGVSPALISSLILTLIMMGAGIIASHGKADLGALINYVCYMASACLFAYLSGRKRKNKPYRKRR